MQFRELTKEEKALLLRDIAPRILFEPRCKFNLQYAGNGEEDGIYDAVIDSVEPYGTCEVTYGPHLRDWCPMIDDVRPYLRPMTSMTEEEVDEIRKRLNSRGNTGRVITKQNFQKFNDILWFCNMKEYECVGDSMMGDVIDYLNEKMFDWRGLIPKDLAIEVTEENNPYNK